LRKGEKEYLRPGLRPGLGLLLGLSPFR